MRRGFPLMTLGLVLGAWWGKLAWGDYWYWDPKEMSALAAWRSFMAYLHLSPAARRKGSALILLGDALIIFTLLWLNLAPRLFPGLHTYAG